jgi:hypothetical protein
MNKTHKEALAAGRKEGQVIRAYLELVDKTRPRRGRQRTKDSISRRLTKIEWEMVDADPISKVRLIQERINLNSELADRKSVENRAELEKQFIKIALQYSERHEISYQAWREFGVDPDVLSQAKIFVKAKP